MVQIHFEVSPCLSFRNKYPTPALGILLHRVSTKTYYQPGEFSWQYIHNNAYKDSNSYHVLHIPERCLPVARIFLLSIACPAAPELPPRVSLILKISS